jgi:hypothetical protein
VGVSHASKTVRERGGPSLAISLSNSKLQQSARLQDSYELTRGGQKEKGKTGGHLYSLERPGPSDVTRWFITLRIEGPSVIGDCCDGTACLRCSTRPDQDQTKTERAKAIRA